MALPKPTSKPDWTVGNPSFGTITIEPSAAKKLTGWQADEKPPHEFFNWLFFNVGTEWIDYLESITDEIAPTGELYDAYVGTSGTHADLNAAILAVSDDARIFVIDALAVTSTQIISKDGLAIHFKDNAAVYSKGTAGTALQITADRVKIIGGRFTGFNGGGEEAIEITAAASNTLITQCSFFDNTTNVQDDGTNSTFVANVEEV